MVKAILFDADGVTVLNKSKYKYFSDKLSAEKNIPREEIIPFFKNEFADCQIGKKDLKIEVEKYFPKWKWEGSSDDFLGYWHADAERNEAVLEIVGELRKKGIKCFLATDQDKYRAEYLLKNLGLADYFDGHFFSYDLGVKKSNGEFFERTLDLLPGLFADEIMYWDDEEENVRIATELGIKGLFYEKFDDFKNVLQLL